MTADNPQAASRRWFFALVATLVVALVLVLSALGLAATQTGLSGMARLVTWISGGSIAIEGAKGRLIGPLRIDELGVERPGLRVRLQDLAMDWKPSSLLRRRLTVSSLSAATVRITALPSPAPTEPPQSLTLPIAVEIERLDVGRLVLGSLGATSGVDHPGIAPVVELSKLSARLSSDGRKHRLSELWLSIPVGRLSGEAQLDGERPFPVDARATLSGASEQKAYRVAATALGTLDAFTLLADADGFDLKGQARIDVTPFASIPLKRAQIEVGEADPAAFRPGFPQAALALRADLQPQRAAQSLPPERWGVAGPIEISNRTPGPIDRGLLPLRALKANASWREGRLELNEIDLAVNGKGRAAGAASYEGGQAKLDLEVRELNLVELMGSLKPTRLAGRVHAAISEVVQELSADLRDPRFALVFEGKRRGDLIEVGTARVTAGEAKLEASGRLSLAGRQPFDVRGRLVRFDPSLYASLPRARVSAEFEAGGDLKPQPDASLRFALHDSVVGGQALAGRGKLQVAPGRIASSDVSLDLTGNRLEAQGAFGRPGDVLTLRLDAPKLESIAGATPWRFSGQLKGEASLSGTLAEPSGQVALTAKDLLLPGGPSLAHLQANGELRDGLDGRFRARAELAGLRLTAKESSTVRSALLDADGTRGNHVLRTRAVLSGNEELVAEAQGALGPQMQWSGTLNTLALRGATPFAFSLAAPATLQASTQRVAFAAAELRGTQARVRLAETLWSRRQIVTRGEFSGLPLAAAAGRKLGLSGDTLRVGGEWDARLAEHVEGSIRIFRESGDLVIQGDSPLRLGLQELELRIHAVNDRLAGSIDIRGSQIGEITGSATALAGRTEGGWGLVRSAPLAASVRLSVPSLAWVGAAIDPNLQTGGALNAEFSVTGTPGSPESQGVIRGDSLTIALADQGLRLDEGVLQAEFAGERLRLGELSFKSSARTRPREARIDFSALAREPGRIRASGETMLSSGKGEYRVEAQRLLLMQRPDRWLMLSGEGTLVTSWQRLNAKGRLSADAGYWELAKAGAPRLGDDVVILGRQDRDAAQRVRMDLDLEADLGRQFYLRGQGLDTRLGGSVRLRGEDRSSALRASGSIRAQGGTYDAYGQELSIERGILNFQGPLENPGLNVLALRKNLPVEAGVSITGTALRPRVQLVSEPNVPDSEKLSWIVLGRAPDQVGGAADSRLLLAAANAILGGESGGISRQVARGLGLDEISVGTGDLAGATSSVPLRTVAGSLTSAGAGTVNSQILTVGKRLSSAAYLSYEQSLSGAANVVKLTYNLSRRLSLIGRAGTLNAIDLFYTFSFN